MAHYICCTSFMIILVYLNYRHRVYISYSCFPMADITRTFLKFAFILFIVVMAFALTFYALLMNKVYHERIHYPITSLLWTSIMCLQHQPITIWSLETQSTLIGWIWRWVNDGVRNLDNSQNERGERKRWRKKERKWDRNGERERERERKRKRDRGGGGGGGQGEIFMKRKRDMLWYVMQNTFVKFNILLLSAWSLLFSIQMMHRLECVGRDCVHKVPLNSFRPNSKVQRAHNSTDPRINPLHNLFYKMGAPKIVKNTKCCYFTDLPDAWQNHASGYYRTHDFFNLHNLSIVT